MNQTIALALIKRLVANGLLVADDIWEMNKELSDTDKMAVQAAWLEGSVPNGNEEFKPVLRVVD